MPRTPTGRPNGVRLTTRQAESTRAKIRSTLIAARVEAFSLGLPDPVAPKKSKRKVHMTRDQLFAAQMLLDRTVAPLQRVEHTGADGGPIATRDDTPGVGGVKSKLAEMMARAASAPSTSK